MRVRHLVLLVDAVVIIAHPLLTAAAGQLGETVTGTAPVRQRHEVWTQGDAADYPINTRALMLAGRLKVFTVLINTSVQLARTTLSFSWK